MDKEPIQEKTKPRIKRLRGIRIKACIYDDALTSALTESIRVTMLGFQPETLLLDAKRSYLSAMRSLELTGFYRPLGELFLKDRVKSLTEEDFDPNCCNGLSITNHLSAGWIEISFNYTTDKICLPVVISLFNLRQTTNYVDEMISEKNGIVDRLLDLKDVDSFNGTPPG